MWARTQSATLLLGPSAGWRRGLSWPRAVGWGALLGKLGCPWLSSQLLVLGEGLPSLGSLGLLAPLGPLFLRTASSRLWEVDRGYTRRRSSGLVCPLLQQHWALTQGLVGSFWELKSPHLFATATDTRAGARLEGEPWEFAGSTDPLPGVILESAWPQCLPCRLAEGLGHSG